MMISRAADFNRSRSNGFENVLVVGQVTGCHLGDSQISKAKIFL